MELRIDGTHFVWNNGDTEPRRDGLTGLRIDGKRLEQDVSKISNIFSGRTKTYRDH